MTNIHSYNPQKRLDNILESDKISEQNKKDVREFHRDLEDRKISKSRRDRYLQSAKQVLEYEENNFRLKEATEEQIRKIDRQIDNSAYYSRDYAQETKKEYRKFLRLYSKFSEYGTTETEKIPDKASFVKLTVSEDAKDRTNPSKLVKSEGIKYLCQNLSLRYRSLLLTHWDLGTRINETLRTRVKDYHKEDGKAYIYVRVNPVQTREGAKSGRRKCRVKVASPSIDRWLEEEHPNPDDPEAYLFCRVKDFEGDKGENELAQTPASYSHFADKLKQAKRTAGLDKKVNTHSIRKARISYMKSNLDIKESHVDKRVGHVPGSRVTRVYTRLGDSDSNNAYGQAYGEENPEDKESHDLLPLECQDCGQTNAGYRDRCYECNGLLEIKEVKELKEPVARAREIVWEKLEDEGIAQEIVDKTEGEAK